MIVGCVILVGTSPQAMNARHAITIQELCLSFASLRFICEGFCYYCLSACLPREVSRRSTLYKLGLPSNLVLCLLKNVCCLMILDDTVHVVSDTTRCRYEVDLRPS